MKNNIYLVTAMIIMTLVWTFCVLSNVAFAHWSDEAVKSFSDSGIFSVDVRFESLDDYIKKGAIDKALKLFYSKDESFISEEQYESTISREEACGLFCKVMNSDLSDTKPTFEDSNQISKWAEPYVATLQEIGIVIGYPDHSFKPQNNLTNAEFVTMLSRIQGTGGITDPPPIELIDEPLEDIEVGILLYSSGETKIEKVEEQIDLSSGEQLMLSIALPDDSSAEYKVFIKDKTIASFDEEYSVLKAINIGNTEITFETNDGKYKKTIKIFINQKEETK